MGLMLPVSSCSGLHSHTCCQRNHLPCPLSQLCSTCLQIFSCPHLSFSILAVSFLSFFKALFLPKNFACALYHCLIIPLIQSKTHSHRATSSMPFTLTLIYISHPSVLKSDLSYTDAFLSLKFLFRRELRTLFSQKCWQNTLKKNSIKSIKPDDWGVSPFSH